MDLFGLSVVGISAAIPRKIVAWLLHPISNLRAYLSSTEDISRHDVVRRLGGLKPYPIREDLWAIRQTSLRGAGYTGCNRFSSSETGISLVGIASVRGRDGQSQREDTVDLALYVNLSRSEDSHPTRVEIMAGSSSSNFVDARKAWVTVDGERILDWQWSRDDGTRLGHRLYCSNAGTPILNLIENLQYKRELDTRVRFEWEDFRTGDPPHRSCVETTGKGLYEAIKGLESKMNELTTGLR